MAQAQERMAVYERDEQEVEWEEEQDFESDAPDAYAEDGYSEDDYLEDEFDDGSDNKQFANRQAYYAASEQEEDYDAEDGDAEQGWDGDEEAYADHEERALVPLSDGPFDQSGMLVLHEEAAANLPVFIAGERQKVVPGVLGHTPLAPRATRPRPFYMHSFLWGVILLTIVVVVVALVPLSGDQSLLSKFSTLAGIIAPPPPPVVETHPYTVHYGDTLQSIADKFGVQAGGILEVNGFESADQIYFGMRIKIPVDATYGSDYQAPLDISLPPNITPAPPYGFGIVPPGFASFNVHDYFGDPWAGSFGQCTWWAHHKRPDENFFNFGDAWNWLYAAQSRNMTVTTWPVDSATVVFEPGVEEAGGIGHVAHVEQLLPDGWVLISEMNFAGNGGGWGRVDFRYITPAAGVYFIH